MIYLRQTLSENLSENSNIDKKPGNSRLTLRMKSTLSIKIILINDFISSKL